MFFLIQNLKVEDTFEELIKFKKSSIIKIKNHNYIYTNDEIKILRKIRHDRTLKKLLHLKFPFSLTGFNFPLKISEVLM